MLWNFLDTESQAIGISPLHVLKHIILYSFKSYVAIFRWCILEDKGDGL